MIMRDTDNKNASNIVSMGSTPRIGSPNDRFHTSRRRKVL